ncbi:MAG: hypothetical protein R3C40_10025 [Parvularculaceae bacterium]
MPSQDERTRLLAREDYVALARAGRIVACRSCRSCNEHGQVNEPWLRGLAADIQALRNPAERCRQTSGAIGPAGLA